MGLTEEDIKLNCKDAGTEAVDESNSADGISGIMSGHSDDVYEWKEGGGGGQSRSQRREDGN